MAKRSRGRQGPANLVDMSFMVVKPVTGEIKDYQKTTRILSGKTGAKACTEKMVTDKQDENARNIANAR